jgi:uncharacterized coiled-coil DUF342 family protein
MDAATFETGLASIKTELEELDLQLRTLHEKAEELKPFVKEYNELKQKEADTKKKRRSVNQTLELLVKFYEKLTGKFPDGLFPLFSQENTQPTNGKVTA